MTTEEMATLDAIRIHVSRLSNPFYAKDADDRRIEWLLGIVDRLAARVAELEAEIDKAIGEANCVVADQQGEITRLRAELAATPPTLEFIRSRSGEPSRDCGEIIEWPSGLEWWRSSNSCRTKDGSVLPTRAAVEAAIAAQNGEKT